MRKVFLSMSLAGGLLAAPFFCGGVDARPQLPDSATLNSIIQGAPQPPAQPAPPAPEGRKAFKKLERALKQNMQSAEALINAARDAGATPQQIADMEKYSVGFLKTFLAAITPSEMTPPRRGDRPQPPADGMRKPGDRPQPPMEGARPPRQGDRRAPAMEGPREPRCPALNPQIQPAPEKRRAPRPDAPIISPKANQQPQPSLPQGMIITAPDGTQWLVTPQQPAPEPQVRRPAQPSDQAAPERRRPPMPPAAQNAPGQANQSLLPPPPPPAPEEEIIIIEEDTVSDMPLWPTKDQMGKDGILKYLEKRNAK